MDVSIVCSSNGPTTRSRRATSFRFDARLDHTLVHCNELHTGWDDCARNNPGALGLVAAHWRLRAFSLLALSWIGVACAGPSLRVGDAALDGRADQALPAGSADDSAILADAGASPDSPWPIPDASDPSVALSLRLG